MRHRWGTATACDRGPLSPCTIRTWVGARGNHVPNRVASGYQPKILKIDLVRPPGPRQKRPRDAPKGGQRRFLLENAGHHAKQASFPSISRRAATRHLWPTARTAGPLLAPGLPPAPNRRRRIAPRRPGRRRNSHDDASVTHVKGGETRQSRPPPPGHERGRRPPPARCVRKRARRRAHRTRCGPRRPRGDAGPAIPTMQALVGRATSPA